MNKLLLNKEKKHYKFENLHKISLESFSFKKRKNKNDKFIVSNNIKAITNRLYPKVIKTNTSEENKDKIIIINKNGLQLKRNNLSLVKSKNKKTK